MFDYFGAMGLHQHTLKDKGQISASILLPFHNAASWISETIQSIQDQSEEDWELIAINDFSTDNSLSILQELAQNDSRIRMYQNENKGIIPALQLGLSKTNGEFVTRMDADDIMPKNRLELMLTKLKSSPEKAIVTGKVRYFSNQAVSEGYSNYEAWLNERVDNNDYFDHIYRECVVASPNWLARTHEIRESGIFRQLIYPEDYDMTFRWMENGFSIYGIPETTLLWREHPDRTSRNSEIYDQESFFKLKLDWFCQLNDLNSLAVLGAGTKGKLAAVQLLQNTVDFSWYDLEWKKYGSPLLGKTVQDYEKIDAALLLVAIYPKNKKPLLAFLNEKGFEIGKNAWFL